MEETLIEGAKYLESQDKALGIVLLHAYTGSPNDMNLLMRKLHRQGYGVLAPKFSGHGTTDVVDIVEQDINTWAQESVQAVQAMKSAGYQELMVFGLSLGGIFATWLMTQTNHGITAGGIFNSPILKSHSPNLDEPFTAYTKAVYERFYDIEKFEQDFDQILAKHHRQMAELDEFKLGFQDRLDQITIPYYIAKSGQDEMVDTDLLDDLPDILSQAQVELYEFPDNSHVITINRNRQDFEAGLIDFIDRHQTS